jgi:hypothetical protein
MQALAAIIVVAPRLGLVRSLVNLRIGRSGIRGRALFQHLV